MVVIFHGENKKYKTNLKNMLLLSYLHFINFVKWDSEALQFLPVLRIGEESCISYYSLSFEILFIYLFRVIDLELHPIKMILFSA